MPANPFLSTLPIAGSDENPRQSKRTPGPNGRPHEKPPKGCRAFGRCALEPSRLPGNLPASGRGVHERTQKTLAKREGTASAGSF